MASSDVSTVVNHFSTANEGFITTLSSTITAGAVTVALTSTSGLTNGKIFVGIIEPGVVGKEQTFTGVVDTGGNQITGVKWTRGTNTGHNAGVTIVDYVTGTDLNMMTKGMLVEHKQTGAHSDITADSLTVSGTSTLGAVTATSLTLAGTATAEGWSPLGDMPDTVTANGNKSYDLVYNGNDLTDTITPGMRLRTARTVAAPDQCTSLNGTTQYYSKSSPSGMTFTDDFSVSAWVKLTSYQQSTIVSRYNGTSGWEMQVFSDGILKLIGFNAASGNFSLVASYQSVPLNRWVHISAQLDMSAFTATTTTSYVMIDGVDVPASVSRGGTNPTALVQAGNLEIGSRNSGTLPFGGKIAQVAVYSAKVTQATHLAAMNQGLVGTETSLASAYSFSNSITDLNTTTPNDLTANGSAVATNTDSPFGNSGVSTTLDYGIVMAASFSTNTTLTVQVPEGCTIPSTSGGVSTVDYSTQNVPYGFPRNTTKWILSVPIIAILSTSGTSTSTTYNPGGIKITVPIGAWLLGYQMQTEVTTSASVVDVYSGLSTSASDMSLLPYLVSRMTMNLASGTGATLWNNNKEDSISISAQTPYYAVIRSTTAFSAAQIRGSSPTATGSESTVLYVKNAYV